MEENEEKKNVNLENETKAQENVSAKDEAKAQENVSVKNEVKMADTKKEASKTEVDNKEKNNFKKVEAKKSKHPIAKAILILIGLLVIIYFVFVMRNYFILNDIREKASKYNDVTNYTYHLKSESGEYTATVKDNITRMDQRSLKEEDQEMILWSDENTGETIVAFPKQKTAQKNILSGVNLTIPFEYTYMDDQLMGMMLYTWIYTDEFDGKECYVLCLGGDFKEWIEKDTGLVVKKDNTEITNIGINTVDEVYKPDLTGYKIIEKNNRRIIKEKSKE